jgi:hypothetical protein
VMTKKIMVVVLGLVLAGCGGSFTSEVGGTESGDAEIVESCRIAALCQPCWQPDGQPGVCDECAGPRDQTGECTVVLLPGVTRHCNAESPVCQEKP